MTELFAPENLRFLAEGLGTTLIIAFVSIFFSLIIGTALGVMRTHENPLVKAVAGLYVEVIRNIPNLLIIFAMRFLTPLRAIEAAILAFTIFTSAAVAEIVRGGMASIGHGQWEAARSQGFSYFKTLRYIILPQVFRTMVPPLVGQFVTVVKDTCFVWAIGIEELTGKGMILMGKYTTVPQIFMLFGSIALIYFALNFSLSAFARAQARRLHVGTIA